MTDLISKAQKWASDGWAKAAQHWKGREQDITYREYVTRPGLKRVLQSISPMQHGTFLDVGCGDGTETECFRQMLADGNHSGMMFAYDPQEELIDAARKKSKGKPINVYFKSGSLDKLIERYDLEEDVDIATSLFVLHDTPDAESVVKQIYRCLNPYGTGIFVIVHPDFSELLAKKGALKVNKQLNPVDSEPWRFVGEYPIVEKDNKTFPVPYFHRTMGDYEKLFRKYFRNIEFIDLKPTEKAVRECEKTERSPFYNHTGNVYYPEIVEKTSSVIIKVQKN